MADIYIKLDDVLALLPDTDIVGPKPSRLRREILELPQLIISDIDSDDDK